MKVLKLASAAAALAILPHPAVAQSNQQWIALFQERYSESAKIAQGWRYTSSFRTELAKAHDQVIAAFRRKDRRAAAGALIRFLDLNRGYAIGGAKFLEGFGHGSGNGGSSNTFASGASAGIAWGTAWAKRHADANPINCVYLYGEAIPSQSKQIERIRQGKQSIWSSTSYLHCKVEHLQHDRSILRVSGASDAILRKLVLPRL